MKGCAARLWQSMQSITRRSPLGTPLPAGSGSKHGLRAIGILPRTQGIVVRDSVGGDVLDVSQVNAVNPGQMRERVQAAQVQNQHGLGLGVLFVVGKVGLDQQLVAYKPRRRVAALAGVPRRAQAGYGRRNRRGIVGNYFGAKCASGCRVTSTSCLVPFTLALK